MVPDALAAGSITAAPHPIPNRESAAGVERTGGIIDAMVAVFLATCLK